MSDIENIIKTTLYNLNNLTDTSKLISTKVDLDNSNFLAISKMNMNFIIGGSDLDKKTKSVDLKPFAGAAYVNFTLNPLLLIYENEDTIKTINVDSESNDLSSIFNSVLSLIKERKPNDEKKK